MGKTLTLYFLLLFSSIVLIQCRNRAIKIRKDNKMEYNLSFYTAYHQFYLADKDSPRRIGSDSFWTDEAFEDRLATEVGILGISTACYGPVKAKLSILEAPKSEIDLNKFDHIVEAGIELKSGILQVLDCPHSSVEKEISLTPGIYRARIYSVNLDTVDGDEGDDFYIIEVWPDSQIERKVIKKWPPYP